MAPLLVTSALPYANGPIHLGHLVEYLQTDVWVRFQRLVGRDVTYVCASDTHGAPIEINAAKNGVAPEAFAARWHDEHRQAFRDFLISVDVFYTTHSPENRRWAEEIFRRLREGGHVEERPLEQWYCENDGRFLPDRFVKGTCPNCGATDQYGDACEVCGKAYASSELKGPYCALCGRPPVRRSSNHYFFQLSHFRDVLEKFVSREGSLHPAVRNSVREWLAKGLEDWCVSRDGPYFGFEIPGAKGKYFYVWLDAPIGYLSSTVHLLGEELALSRFWNESSGARIVHFIGKDIVYFHALFWPAMLAAAGLHLPDRVQVHGMLTLGGEKLSKSRGKMVTARQWLDAGLDPEALRWFYAASLSAGPYDVPLSAEEIRNRVNAELVKTLANFVSRALSPLRKDLGGVVGRPADDESARALWSRTLELSATIRERYEAIELRDAVQAIVQLGFEANKWLQDRAPWTKRKKGDEAGALADLSLAANVAYAIGTWVSPILPRSSERLASMLGVPRLDPARLGEGFPVPEGTRLGEIGHLAAPIEDDQLDRLWPQAGEAAPAAAPGKAAPAAAPEKAAPATKAAASPEGVVTYEHFLTVELKVARVLAAKRVEGADRLLELSIDAGEGSPRTIVAGIALAYAPEAVVGKNVVIVGNLAPRRIRGIDSRGMLLAAGGEGGSLVLAEVPGASPGQRVK